MLLLPWPHSPVANTSWAWVGPRLASPLIPLDLISCRTVKQKQPGPGLDFKAMLKSCCNNKTFIGNTHERMWGKENKVQELDSSEHSRASFKCKWKIHCTIKIAQHNFLHATDPQCLLAYNKQLIWSNSLLLGVHGCLALRVAQNSAIKYKWFTDQWKQ